MDFLTNLTRYERPIFSVECMGYLLSSFRSNIITIYSSLSGLNMVTYIMIIMVIIVVRYGARRNPCLLNVCEQHKENSGAWAEKHAARASNP